MKILGIDISSRSTGLGLIEDDTLLEYTKINPTGTMCTAAKLNLFFVELEKFIFKHKPNFIAIEDVIQVSSVSVTKILARFNGVGLLCAYRFNKQDPKLFIPGEWKKIVGLESSVKKCETQLFVCEKYNLLQKSKIEEYRKKIEEVVFNNKMSLESVKDNLLVFKKDFAKKKGKTQEQLEKLKENISVLNLELLKKKKSSRAIMEKSYDDLSMDIYVETGVNEDIADAISVALAYKILMSK
jgi:Holliday junction resolvasome RuvABC endonuclease subunit